MAVHLRSLASTVRWRLKPLRWAGKIAREVGRFPKRSMREDAVQHVGNPSSMFFDLQHLGYAKSPKMLDIPPLPTEKYKGQAYGKAFVDIRETEEALVDQLFSEIVNDAEISGSLYKYFSGNIRLWNIALNYSDVSDQLLDSQLWHFDYGDTKQLHIMVYMTDVDEETGAFTFFDAPTSKKIDRNLFFIERFTDKTLLEKYDIDAGEQSIRLCGARGDIFINDPGRLLHQGARCSKPRLVLFISFATPTPMSSGGKNTISDAVRKRLVKARSLGKSQSSIPDSAIL